MTKERKQAIDMWLWIRNQYEYYEDYWKGSGDEDGFTFVLKEYYEDETGFPVFNWKCGCWLCQYVPHDRMPMYPFNCTKCPLISCGAEDSPFHRLDCHFNIKTEQDFRDCCTQIARALGYKGE